MILCPRCEEPVNGECEKCRRAMTRRYFFGLVGGAAAAVAAPVRKYMLADGCTGTLVEVEMSPDLFAKLRISTSELCPKNEIWFVNERTFHATLYNLELPSKYGDLTR